MFLAEACASDRGLRDEVESLLRLAPSAERWLDAPSNKAALVGTRLGPYEITGLLGAGGMAVVYRARDLRLDREVAIKILPAPFAEDRRRLARFEREARLLASINHPRIATIHGLERTESQLFLVLELVGGQTLAQCLAARRLAVSEALSLAREIAEGLEAAHQRGIIHRDLKPANVQVTVDGSVKLLDFGLAKALASDPADAGAEGQMTGVGLIVGTATYMSPEQARAQAVDRRADIWAFGCVLYELLTGRRAFPGDTVSDTLAAVLAREPDWSALPTTTPPAIRQLLCRCLQKDPARRVRDIADVRLEIEQTLEATFNMKDEFAPGARTLSVQRASWPWAMLVLFSLVLVAGSVAWLAWRFPQSTVIPRAVPLTALPGTEVHPSLSPDGNYIAFMWTGPKQDNPDIYVQQINAGDPHRLTTDARSDYNPVWSPDGRWIAFLRAGRLPQRSAPAGTSELRLIPPLGGPERKLGELQVRIVGTPGFLAWCPDSSCLIATDSQGEGRPDALFVLSIETGEKRQLTSPPPSMLGDCNPAVSPDGKSLVFRRVPAASAGELYWLRLERGLTAGGDPKRLTAATMNAAYPAWMPDGKEILFSARRKLWRLAIPGDARAAPVPFVGEDGLMPAISRSQPGGLTRLVYVRSFSDTNIWRLETSATGAAALAPPVVAISSTRSDLVGEFSPDGRQVAFASNRSGEFKIWLADPDGANAVPLTSASGAMAAAPGWSPDGRLIAFQTNLDGQFEIYVIAAAGGKPRRITSDPANDHVPSFSRDGKWIYFGSTRSGSSQAGDYQIWKVPARGGEPVRVTQNGGFKAIEGIDGAHLYYTQAPGRADLWRIPTSGGPTVRLLEEVVSSAFAVLDKGIYYIDQPSDQARLQFFDFATGRSTTVGRGLGEVQVLLTASPDGRTILYSRQDSLVDDLMLVDNFR